MNEKIKQFSTLADHHALSLVGSVNHHNYANIRDTKFAELIVQECIDILPQKVEIKGISGAHALVTFGTVLYNFKLSLHQ